MRDYRSPTLFLFALTVVCPGFAQIDLLPGGQPSIDSTLTELPFEDWKPLGPGTPLDLSTDDQVAQIRAEQWEATESGALPDYAMPIYQPDMLGIISLVPIDTTVWHSLRVLKLPPADKQQGDDPQ